MRTHKITLTQLVLLVFTFASTLGAALCPTAICTAQPSPVQAATGPDKKLVIEIEVPAPIGEVWKAFTTSDGLMTWLAPKATVDLRPGGDWIVSFPGGSSTGGGAIVSFVPEKELAIDALAPDQFPHVRAERTRAVFTFEARSDAAHGDSTVVRLTQTGWKTGKEWDRAYEYLVAGNAELFSALYHRFTAGPIDWAKMAAGSEGQK